ncbi:hypothetical protein CEW46_27640, partial [Bacillus cereus]
VDKLGRDKVYNKRLLQWTEYAGSEENLLHRKIAHEKKIAKLNKIREENGGVLPDEYKHKGHPQSKESIELMMNKQIEKYGDLGFNQPGAIEKSHATQRAKNGGKLAIHTPEAIAKQKKVMQEYYANPRYKRKLSRARSIINIYKGKVYYGLQQLNMALGDDGYPYLNATSVMQLYNNECNDHLKPLADNLELIYYKKAKINHLDKYGIDYQDLLLADEIYITNGAVEIIMDN